MSNKKKIVVLTGAGISAESGIPTFRGSVGLWEGYRIEEVASPQGFQKNPTLVFNFYNLRRRAALNAKPNHAHLQLAKLEDIFDVHIITQNVDDLHERANSTQVVHLHGKLNEARSLKTQKVYSIEGTELNEGDLCPSGGQLRPNIVWFGEAVPMMDKAISITQTADIFLVIGTSLQVYPAASLLDYVPSDVPIYLIDPNAPLQRTSVHVIQDSACKGMDVFIEELENKFK
jgi:NAD-dependent deacetylase